MSESDKDKEIAELKTQLAEMKAAVLTLQRQVQRQINPPPPQPARLEHHIDAATRRLFDGVAKMPQEVVQKMSAAIPDDVMRDIANDARRDRR